MPSKHHITVCICTYKRPELLRRLLTKLEEQQTDGLFDFAVVVVDNDKLGSAYQTVSEYAIQSAISINYFVEPEQNIAMARNKTIENAKGDYIGFIDDDEFPESQWLLKLYKAILHYEADGILSPVLPHFEISPPSWVLKGKFFERHAPATGQVLDWQNTRTGNALLKKDLFIEQLDDLNNYSCDRISSVMLLNNSRDPLLLLKLHANLFLRALFGSSPREFI